MRQTDPEVVTALTHRPWSMSRYGDGVPRFASPWKHQWMTLVDVLLDWAHHHFLWKLCGISAFLVQKNFVSPWVPHDPKWLISIRKRTRLNSLSAVLLHSHWCCHPPPLYPTETTSSTGPRGACRWWPGQSTRQWRNSITRISSRSTTSPIASWKTANLITEGQVILLRPMVAVGTPWVSTLVLAFMVLHQWFCA